MTRGSQKRLESLDKKTVVLTKLGILFRVQIYKLYTFATNSTSSQAMNRIGWAQKMNKKVLILRFRNR